MSTPDRYIWMVGWERYQTFQLKRGRLWTPPWIKLYTGLLDDPDYRRLSARRRALLHGLWMIYGRCPAGGRLMLGDSVAEVGRIVHDESVRRRDLDSLQEAGWIEICSRTVLEQRWAMFWNCSRQEEDKEKEQNQRRRETKTRARENLCPLDHGCHLNGAELYQHLRAVHGLADLDARHVISEHTL